MLISAQPKPEEDICPYLEFAPACGVNIARRAEEKHEGTYEADHTEQRESEEPEAHNTKNKKDDANQTKQNRPHWLIKAIISKPAGELPRQQVQRAFHNIL